MRRNGVIYLLVGRKRREREGRKKEEKWREKVAALCTLCIS